MATKKISGKNYTRREFMKTSGILGAGAVLARAGWAQTVAASPPRKRYAIVGMGSRSLMYQKAIQQDYIANAELVGVCDVNYGRLILAQRRSRGFGRGELPIYYIADFDRLIADARPDVVIITTVDAFHHDFIIWALQLGCDVITEKPLTIDEGKCQQIIDVQKKTGKKVLVTFNYRYSPPRTQVKDLLMTGEIGDVLSVDFQWMLNTIHGADYFRRWHSQKKYSGGLMVHKASHHFDLVNWWLSAIPVSVFATGKREFYTPNMARRMGLQSSHERCLTCPEKDSCGFFLNLRTDKNLKTLYLDNEKYDHYFRDRCVFRPEIDIEDTMNVLVRYDNNVTMDYSLNAFNAWEGYQIIFNGTRGRLEHRIEEKIYISGTDTEQGGIREGGTTIRIIPLRGEARDIEVRKGEGSHGGGDKLMLDDLFLPRRSPDKYLRAADFRAGAYSALTGIAANRSIATGKEIRISDLIQNLNYPDFPSMPTRSEPVPMPGKI
jgi:predicted dehydrogenase